MELLECRLLLSDSWGQSQLTRTIYPRLFEIFRVCTVQPLRNARNFFDSFPFCLNDKWFYSISKASICKLRMLMIKKEKKNILHNWQQFDEDAKNITVSLRVLSVRKSLKISWDLKWDVCKLHCINIDILFTIKIPLLTFFYSCSREVSVFVTNLTKLLKCAWILVQLKFANHTA